MNDNLPPLPPEGFVWNDTEHGDMPVAFTADQMQAYARAAIERKSVPTMPVAEITNIGDFGGFVKWLVHDGDLLKAGDRLFAAAPQPEPDRQSVPAGWKMVPIEPTDEMTDATYAGQHCSDIWRDMTAAAPQPQPVPPEGPMAENVEQAARDVAKCLNERDGQGLDLRHVAMLVHYAQQPVQEPVKGWWAHTCPEDGKVDVVNYQLTPADKRAGWVEHEVYTSPQSQPEQPLSNEQITKLPVWRHFVGLMPEHHVEITRAIEQAHGIRVTK